MNVDLKTIIAAVVDVELRIPPVGMTARYSL